MGLVLGAEMEDGFGPFLRITILIHNENRGKFAVTPFYWASDLLITSFTPILIRKIKWVFHY